MTTLTIIRGLPGSGMKVPLYRREGATRWGEDIEIEEYALVDEEDYPLVIRYTPWRLHSAGYAARKVVLSGKRVTLLMHRLVLGLGEGPTDVHVDHKNHHQLDNQKSNLVPGSQQDNNRNTPEGPRSDSSSKFKGVGRYRGHWRAQGWTEGKTVWLGAFGSEEAASEAYLIWKDAA